MENIEMRKFIITWDAGYGEAHQEIEAENYDKALEEAYEMWKEETESKANYSAEEYTDELAEESLRWFISY